ncbi:hypothetical protein RB195_001521 [Necator americanus]|uniref:NR LBD domain-containing protein n=1 Tax=Necator americanus TaxID=51031 RepID=A0ABR1DEQ1_NECAM
MTREQYLLLKLVILFEPLGTRFGPVESVIMETAWLKYRSVLVNLVKRNNPKLDYEGVVDRIVALSEIVPYLEIMYSHEKDQRDITAHTFMLTTLRLPSPVKTYEKIVSAYRKLSVITRDQPPLLEDDDNRNVENEIKITQDDTDVVYTLDLEKTCEPSNFDKGVSKKGEEGSVVTFMALSSR